MNRILHVDGDSFFASCEIALDKKLQGRAVWVGGGRRGEQRRVSKQLREPMAEVERARAAVQAQLDAAQSLPAASTPN